MKKARIFLMMVIIAIAFTLMPKGANAAKKPTLNLTKVTLPKNAPNGNGHQYLWVKGTTKKVKWSTSNKKIVTIEKTGTKNCISITAKKKGKATVTATVGKTKLKCKVTVTKAMSKKDLAKFVKIDTSTIGRQYFTVKNTSSQYYLGVHMRMHLYNNEGNQADWDTPHAYLAPKQAVKIWIDNPHQYTKADIAVENTWIDYEYHPIKPSFVLEPVTPDKYLPVVVTNKSEYKEALYYVTVFFIKNGEIVWTLQSDTDKDNQGLGINPGVSRRVLFYLNEFVPSYDKVEIQINRCSGY